MKLDKKERIALIRKGNELFNGGEFDKAIKIFLETDYKDGLARAGDFYFYDKKSPLIAFKFYKLANMHDRVADIFKMMIMALGKWIGEDKVKNMPAAPNEKSIPVKISPKLKILAEEIIRDYDKNREPGADKITK